MTGNTKVRDITTAHDELYAALLHHTYQVVAYSEYGIDDGTDAGEGETARNIATHRSYVGKIRSALVALVGERNAADALTVATQKAKSRVHGD